jgi:NAD+ kinase
MCALDPGLIMLNALRNVALVWSSTDAEVSNSLLSLAPHLTKRGLRVWINANAPLPFSNGAAFPCSENELANRADLVIAVGGDGTLLRAAHLVAHREIPLLGINHGRLGFLTDISPSSMLEDVDLILDGAYIEDRRSLLQTKILREEGDDPQRYAMNDVVVTRSGHGRILELETRIDGRFVNAHRGDGLVIASATGSTAYALSCGGPIVVPDLAALLLAPICPHALSDRPLLVCASSVIEVKASSDSSGIRVCCDGVVIGDLTSTDAIQVQRSRAHVTLLHPPDYDYYRLIRSKLNWGRSAAIREDCSYTESFHQNAHRCASKPTDTTNGP